MNTREYQNYKRMTKMTVRFLEKDGTISNSKIDVAATATTTTTKSTAAATTTSLTTTTTTARATTPTPAMTMTEQKNAKVTFSSNLDKNESTPTASALESLGKSNQKSIIENLLKETNELTQKLSLQKSQKSANGRYVNWSSNHATLAGLPWCCIGDLMAFCDKYEYRTLSRNDPQLPNRIINEVKTLLSGPAPFDARKRFPSDIHSPENLWVCIGRCTGVEYHLNRIISLFRKPLDKLSADKQRMVRHDFHLAINELRLDISARISEVRLYDQNIFEKDFKLQWQEEPIAAAAAV